MTKSAKKIGKVTALGGDNPFKSTITAIDVMTIKLYGIAL